MEIHGTVHGTSTVHVPSYVKNHGILSGRDLQFLLRETKVGVWGGDLISYTRWSANVAKCRSCTALDSSEKHRFMLNVYIEQGKCSLYAPCFSCENSWVFLQLFLGEEGFQIWWVSLALALKDGVLLTLGYVSLYRRKGRESFDFFDLWNQKPSLQTRNRGQTEDRDIRQEPGQKTEL